MYFFFWAVVDFLWEDVIYHYDYFEKLIINRKLENNDFIAKLFRIYEVKKVIMSAYYSQANEMIEYNHKLIVDALSKISDKGSTNKMQNLPTVLWVDWLTIRNLTSLTLYYICYRSKLVPSIKLKIPTWRILPWKEVHSSTDFLAIHAWQL